MKILIVGGAGYIGSHMVLLLRGQSHDVMVLDDLSSGHAEAVPEDYLVRGDIADTALLDRLFTDHRFEAVMHFASFIQVGESVEKPAKYYGNNVVNTIKLIDAMVRHGVDRFVFSSTAAIFGQPLFTPITI
ncbi:MAG: NAD-dependent epimerase/dehydratase family protein [Candidatus Binatia bacterium]